MPGYVLLNFFIYAVINAFTPGPGNILALNTVTNYGWKKGMPLFLGIFTGGLKASAGGITAAILSGLIASLIFKAKDKS